MKILVQSKKGMIIRLDNKRQKNMALLCEKKVKKWSLNNRLDIFPISFSVSYGRGYKNEKRDCCNMYDVLWCIDAFIKDYQ